MKASTFDKKFDRGEDITAHLDLSRVRRPNLEQQRVNVDFPVWMIEALDKEAVRVGVPRQSVIKMWLAERLQETVAEVKTNGRARRTQSGQGSVPKHA
jgi:hypothetical protein